MWSPPSRPVRIGAVLVESQSSMPSSRSTPTAHGVGGGDLELVKGVGMLRLEGARSYHAGHGPVRVGDTQARVLH